MANHPVKCQKMDEIVLLGTKRKATQEIDALNGQPPRRCPQMDDGETMVGNPLETGEQTIGGSAEENNIQDLGRRPPTKLVQTTPPKKWIDGFSPSLFTDLGDCRAVYHSSLSQLLLPSRFFIFIL